MTTARRLLPDGHAGIVETLAALTALKEFYGAQVSMRSAALDIAGSLADDDQTAQADRRNSCGARSSMSPTRSIWS